VNHKTTLTTPVDITKDQGRETRGVMRKKIKPTIPSKAQT
jgi:hypothetical protein